MQWLHFEFGWLNLWILAVVIFATPVLLNRVRGARGKRGWARATTLPAMAKEERIAYMLIMAPQFLLPLYTLLVPFADSVGLMVAGLGIFTAGQAFRLKSIWDYSAAPPDQLITRGLYRLSRHPGYFGATLTYLGMGIAGGSWLIVAVAFYWFVGYQWVASIEERFCQERWPEAFADYQRTVAKNFVFF